MNTYASMPNTALETKAARGGKLAVVKVGGAPLSGGADTTALAHDLQRVIKDGWRVVVVHGGGSQASELMQRLSVESTFIDGLRVTDEAVLSAAVMAFMEVNTNLAAALAAQGLPAVGLAGSAAGLIQAQRRQHVRPGSGETVDLGWVGDVHDIRPAVIQALWATNCLPVVAPIGLGGDGHLYNVNADTVAGALAAGLMVNQCLLLTDVPGLLTAPPGDDDGQPAGGVASGRGQPEVISRLTWREAKNWLDSGRLTGGMRPKVAAALTAAQAGVNTVRIVDGRQKGVISRHVLDGADDGTVIAGRKN